MSSSPFAQRASFSAGPRPEVPARRLSVPFRRPPFSEAVDIGRRAMDAHGKCPFRIACGELDLLGIGPPQGRAIRSRLPLVSASLSMHLFGTPPVVAPELTLLQLKESHPGVPQNRYGASQVPLSLRTPKYVRPSRVGVAVVHPWHLSARSIHLAFCHSCHPVGASPLSNHRLSSLDLQSMQSVSLAVLAFTEHVTYSAESCDRRAVAA